MRILFLADRLSERGGADWHLLGVIAERVAADDDVHLAVARIDDGAGAPCPVRVVRGLDARATAPVALEELVGELRPDLLWLQNVMNPEALRWAASGRLEAVVTVQDHRVFCPGRGKWTAAGAVCGEPMSRARCAGCFGDDGYFEEIFSLTEERLLPLRRLPCRVLSRYMARELCAMGLSADQIRVTPPHVRGLTGVRRGEARSAEGAAVPDGPPCVLFAGRLVGTKGVRDAIEIWRRAATGLPLVVAGAGPERGSLPALDGLELRGWVPHHELPRLFARARALLLPSRWQEPFGIVGLEAQSLGVPVVAWRSGGVDEWHPGPLCDWGDVDGMAETLRKTVALSPEP
jgi:glycosyltransferase involved in cell wall biosynthesis